MKTLQTIQTICLALIALAIIKVTVRAESAPPAEQLFKAHEIQLSLYGTGTIATDAREKEAVSIGTGIGADYFITRGLGFGARAETSDASSSFIDRSSGRVIARAPLWDRVAPYGYVEGGYDFEEDRVFAGSGGGVEFRFTKGVGVFGELGLETTTRGGATGRAAAGLRLAF